MISTEKVGRKFRFTKKGIDALPRHDSKSKSTNQEYSDQECIGLRIFIGKSQDSTVGRKTWHLRYRLSNRKRVIKIGEYPGCSVAEARDQANEFKNLITKGIDPLGVREKQQGVPTFKEFAEGDYLSWAKEHKRSWKDDERMLRVDIIPVFGKLQLSSIITRDVQQYMNKIKTRASGPTANRHFATIAKLFRLATEWDIIPVTENPCPKIKKFKESSGKERFLSGPEIKLFLNALDSYGENASAYVLKFLLFTGLRKNEALGLSWKDVDLEKGTVQIKMERSKSGRARYVALNSLAADVLRKLMAMRAPGNDFVFPGQKKNTHLVNPEKIFRKAKEECGISDLRIHDLRHSNASLAVAAGSSLYAVQKNLGHSSSQTTQRYAHLCDQAVKESAESVASAISNAIGGV